MTQDPTATQDRTPTAGSAAPADVLDLGPVEDLVAQGKGLAADLLEQSVRDRATAQVLRGYLDAAPAEG